MTDNEVYAGFWKLAAAVVITFILMGSACTMHQNHEFYANGYCKQTVVGSGNLLDVKCEFMK